MRPSLAPALQSGGFFFGDRVSVSPGVLAGASQGVCGSPCRPEREGCKVIDANGQSLAYFYARENDNDAHAAAL